MKVIFAGGGTGGHLYPALALADEMKERIDPFEALFVGAKLGMEEKILGEYGYKKRLISSSGMRGKKFFGILNTVFKLAVGIIQSMIIQLKYKPDIVVGFGGYASAAVVIASYILRRPVLLQEQNSVPGITNRYLSRVAARVYLGYAEAAKYFKKKEKLLVTGNPLRAIITDKYSGKSHESFGLNKNLPTLLVFGGSQGARSLNRAAVEYFLSNKDAQGIVQTGTGELEWVKEKLESVSGVFVCDYILNIRDAYEAADVAMARSGALSVSELAAIGVPSILVPYPYSVDDHQTVNARFLESAGAAVIINDSELNGEKLAEIMNEFTRDTGMLEAMRESALKVGIRNATSVIVDDIVEFSKRGFRGTPPGSSEIDHNSEDIKSKE